MKYLGDTKRGTLFFALFLCNTILLQGCQFLGLGSLFSARNGTALFSVVAPPAPPKDFTFSDFDDPGTGFAVETVIYHLQSDPTQITATISKKSETGSADSRDGIVQSWVSDTGGIAFEVHLKNVGYAKRAEMRFTLPALVVIDQVDMRMPWVHTPVSNDRWILDSYKGGHAQNLWPTEGYSHQNNATWPGFGYSPVVVFYNHVTGEGVGLTAFNDKLHETTLFWVTGADRIDPHVRFQFDPYSQQSADPYVMELRPGWNMPNSHLTYYRENFLKPFMDARGIPESGPTASGIWAGSGWPDNPNSDMVAAVQETLQAGMRGYIQWSPPDGKDAYYDPYPGTSPFTFTWINTLLSASKLPGLQGLGVLVDPFITHRINNCDASGQCHSVERSIQDPAALAEIEAERRDMASRGVNFAFWDTGSNPRNGTGEDYIHQLLAYKRAGISVAAESSSDIAVWITGAVLYYPYGWNDFSVAKVVTPYGSQLVHTNWVDQQTVNGVTLNWWDDAVMKGVVPVIPIGDATIMAVWNGPGGKAPATLQALGR